MKLNIRHAAGVGAAIGAVLLVSYAAADPGRGHAYGHSQTGNSVGSGSGGAASGGSVSGAQLTGGDGTAALTVKTGDEFFINGTKIRGMGNDFVQGGGDRSQFLNASSSDSKTTAGATSATTTASKTGSVSDAAAPKPDWLVNASSDRSPKAKPSPVSGDEHPSPSATPGATASPIPTQTGTPYPVDVPDVFPSGTPEGHILPPGQPPTPKLTPSQPAINPPPDI